MEGIKESIKDIIDLGDNYLIELKNPQVKLKTFLENGSEVHNVNISIASAVTAYARIYMSQFKNNHSLASQLTYIIQIPIVFILTILYLILS
jgi:hypothetical protein